MSVRKSERLMNLLIMLLVQRHYVPKGRIREMIYPGSSDEAFEKMFERDKDELRSLGVPVEIGQIDSYFEDEPGYRIRPDDLALPEIDLTPDEASVIGLATRVWQHAKLAEATTDAVRKLTALGVPVDTAALDIVEPRLAAEEPAFDVFWEAVQERRPVAFDYRTAAGTETTTRHLQPWGVTRYAGRWYVVGLDTDRGEERVFRLSRVQGEARPDGPPAAYDPATFGEGNAYYSGALMWHEIRGLLGDEVFWRLVREWPASRPYGTAAYDDLVAWWSQESGRDLAPVFDAWLLGETSPARS